jgi:hypothetical protein
MFSSANIRIIAIAAIYVLHITFFDALMSNGGQQGTFTSFTSLPAAHNSQSKSSGESSYRLLTKHVEAKQLHVSLPDFSSFISGLTSYAAQQPCTIQGQCSSFLHLNGNVFRLYSLFRVFLI